MCCFFSVQTVSQCGVALKCVRDDTSCLTLIFFAIRISLNYLLVPHYVNCVCEVLTATFERDPVVVWLCKALTTLLWGALVSTTAKPDSTMASEWPWKLISMVYIHVCAVPRRYSHSSIRRTHHRGSDVDVKHTRTYHPGTTHRHHPNCMLVLAPTCSR